MKKKHFAVHKKLVKSRFEPPINSKSKELVYTALTVLPVLGIGFITIMACGIKSIVLIPFFLFLGVVSFSLMTLPLQTGCIWMKEKILFIDDMHWLSVRRFNYNQISLLHIGPCPEEFRKLRKNVPFGTEEWTHLYGKYIVARASDNSVMFALYYSDEAWDYLTERCKDTVKYILSEEDWYKYCEEQKQLEEKTLQENNYNEIISKFDNYVN